MVPSTRETRPHVPVMPRVKLQPVFQPGASPAGLTNRFLVYNDVGIVKSYEGDAERSLDIEFHDIAVHHALHLANNDGYSIAALSSSVLALAAKSSADGPAKVSVNYFSSSDLNKEWSVSMPEEEDITGVAAGDTWVAVTTSCQHLRLLDTVLCIFSGKFVPAIIGHGD